MSAMNLPLFERLTPLLDPLNPAEVHGLLCGLLCAESDLKRERWLELAGEALAGDANLTAPVQDVLAKLFDYGLAQMNDPDGAIRLLLPDDDAPLPQRVAALGDWCEGFLYGVGVGHIKRPGILSGESQEFLRDVANIVQISFEGDSANDADEMAYAEVVEYLRIGLLIIQQDLRMTATPAPSSPH